jgi:hypothetical protein
MMGKFFILLGIIFIVLGVVLLVLGPGAIKWKLPGDIICRRENFTFYFPVTTCILISIILTLIIRFLFKR